MARHTTALVAIALCLAGLGATPAGADPPPTSPTPVSNLYLEWLSGWSQSPIPGGDQFRIALDPETGQWGNVPMDRSRLGLSAVPAPALVIHRPDGSTEILVDPSWVDYLVARIGPDGRPTFGCAQGADGIPAAGAPFTGAPDR